MALLIDARCLLKLLIYIFNEIEFLSVKLGTIGCLAKKYVQLKIFILEKLRNKFKQIFHGCENNSFSSFGSSYPLNILEQY